MQLRLFILILLFSVPGTTVNGQKHSKRITISGAVKDVNLKPVAGAMILVDSKTTSCVTDDRGFYKLKVKPDSKMISIFTFPNHVIEVEINGKTEINFTLASDGSTITNHQNDEVEEEVVDVGYGTVRKKDLLTPVGKIDGVNKRYASYRNIYDMLIGEVSGVQVSGRSIKIDGPSVFSGSSEPLIIVDGIAVNNIDIISPQMVKSIEVLRGSSAAIYGTRGAFGVILINLIGPSDVTRK
jgi:TonB-dependent SusC/RagA subfamily outer membrane receptor